MSNQVYANSNHKYYPCPGLNTWATSGVAVPTGGSQITVPFAATIITQSPQYVSANAGIFTVNDEGVYSISAKIGFNGGPGSTNPLSLRFSLILSGGFTADGTRLCDIEDNFMYSNDAERVITLTYVGYFGKNSSFRCVAQNTHLSNAAAITAVETGMIICKLI